MKRYIIPFVVVSCSKVVTEVDDSDEVGTDVSSDIGYIRMSFTLENFQLEALFVCFVLCDTS